MSTVLPRTVYDIGDREVTLPCEVRDASAASAMFLVSASVARTLLPTDEVVPVTPVPGRAVLLLTMIDYRDNDLGSYDELSIALVVRPPGMAAALRGLTDLLRGRMSTWILHLPVDEEFSCAAGRQIWGFPKTVEDLEITRDGDHALCTWRIDGEEVLKLWLPASGSGSLPEAVLETYTHRAGELMRTRFVMSGQQARIGRGGARIWLADHPATAGLRSLGLPRPAVTTTWMGRMRGRFDPPVRVA